MSDFDKEAEREKLREKYERDQAEREATQRMSDLLLKGATMTNSHCGTCGDPLFQQDGTTFCPSCHGNPDAVSGTDIEAQPAENSSEGANRADTAARDTGDGTESPPTDADATAESESEPATTAESVSEPATTREPTAADDRPADRQPAQSPTANERTNRADTAAHGSSESEARTRVPSQDGSPSTESDASGRSAPRRSSGEDRRSVSSGPSATPGSIDADLETARESLVRALETFAAEAAATDDPRYAAECLEAAREASETLNTLR